MRAALDVRRDGGDGTCQVTLYHMVPRRDWRLAKILVDNIVSHEQGDPQQGQGMTPDRIISVTDPHMRHGRKSRAYRFDGFKVGVSSDLSQP